MEFFAEQNLKKLGATLSASLVLTVTLFFIMQMLIAVGDVELDDEAFRIADVTMPDRELELMADMERPQEEEPPPETMPPEFDMTPPAEMDNSQARPNLSFKGKKAGVFADGSYVPIFQVPPIYPRRALERGIEGCAMLQFTVTKVGSTKDPEVLWSQPPGIFDRAAMRSALKYKYKPQIRDGEAVAVPNVKTIIVFKIEEPGKSQDYTPEGCA
jgi:periplasmic protein TonB|tara:strand:- start:5179 stop:5820 length:642 start_codon:yes stop_codon:yes gene_type:complete